ncbi:hypothetical protein NE865_11494 [Phthorimaea operculella]|nr:hypothetical protein NE865_11494 [Phthorimaea operculella]
MSSVSATTKTPPSSFSAANTSYTMDIDDYVNSERRKRNETLNDTLNETKDNSINHSPEFGHQQPAGWNEKLEECIRMSVEAAVKASIAIEMSGVRSDLKHINDNISQLKLDNANIQKILQETDTKLHEVEKSVNFVAERQDTFETRLSDLENKVAQSSELPSKCQLLEDKIASLEQQARQCNAEISNLPEKKNENLLSILESICRFINLPVKMPIDIVSIHRVPHANQNNSHPKNIIIKFATRILRDNFISAFRAKKTITAADLTITGPPHTIYCNEHLTLAKKILFRQCRETATQNGYKYKWIKHGTILVRKNDTSPVIAIRSPQDISKIK